MGKGVTLTSEASVRASLWQWAAPLRQVSELLSGSGRHIQRQECFQLKAVTYFHRARHSYRHIYYQINLVATTRL